VQFTRLCRVALPLRCGYPAPRRTDAGTPEGQQLCLQSVTVPDGSTFLDTIHMQIINKMLGSELPDGSFTFSAALYNPGTGCMGALLPQAGATPASTVLLFETK
jgi:hypothetical protein